jgi:hypothetical protein
VERSDVPHAHSSSLIGGIGVQSGWGRTVLRLRAMLLSSSYVSEFACGLLTVKLRGRALPPDLSRGCTLYSSTRGDTTDPHGPLERLLGARASGLTFQTSQPQ